MAEEEEEEEKSSSFTSSAGAWIFPHQSFLMQSDLNLWMNPHQRSLNPKGVWPSNQFIYFNSFLLIEIKLRITNLYCAFVE